MKTSISTELREEMNMTRSTLFRKLHALTGQSPTEFIRTIRLKSAASLLKQHFGNVTQVSLEVGFNNLSYFNRSFKKLFGVSPLNMQSQYDPDCFTLLIIWQFKFSFELKSQIFDLVV